MLEDEFKAYCAVIVQASGCTPMQARAFVLSQPEYYPRLCPIPEGSLFSSIRRKRILHLRHLLNVRSPQVTALNDPILHELETEIARIEFAGKMPPLVTRTHIRRELLMRGLEQSLLRKAFRSMAVIDVGDHVTRRPPQPLMATANRLAHNSTAVLSVLLAMNAFGQALSSRCVGCSEVGLLTASFFAAWLSYCFFLVGPDWEESNRLLERLGF